MCIKHCPVCGFCSIGEFSSIYELRQSYVICSCCGCEFGYDDTEKHYEKWIEAGCEWFCQKDKPENWSLSEQIKNQIRPWPPQEGSQN